MRSVGADEVHRLLEYPGLVDALDALYCRGVDRLDRCYLEEPLPRGGANSWTLLPAWQFGHSFGAKLVSVFAGNAVRGIPSVQGLYCLFDGVTGQPLLVIDGAALTLRKTAANSALAARYLARPDAMVLAMLGAGALAPHLIRAHAAVRPIRRVLIWNRTSERARALAAELCIPGVEIRWAPDLEAAVREADIVSCATMATAPLVRGAWLRPGSHLDLVGGYRPDMREADDEAIRRASRVHVDARFTTIAVAGDVAQPIAAGLRRPEEFVDGFELAQGTRPGRQQADEITWFKSGGGGHEDLGTAQHLLARLGRDDA